MVDLEVQYRIANAAVRDFPYPHILVHDVFPDDFYRELPYVPNTLFAFMKTANSFHGVEPIREAGIRRDLMLYDIRLSS